MKKFIPLSVFALVVLTLVCCGVNPLAAGPISIAALFVSPVWSNIRGSIGGTTYSRNKSGAVARNRTKPVNPNTAAQSAVRNLFGSLSAAWRNLTDVQRDQWSTMTPNYPYINSVGQSAEYSGQQLYNKLNNNLIASEQTTIDVPLPPALFLPNFCNLAEIDITADSFEVGSNLTDGTVQAIVYATPRLSAGIANVNKYFKKIAVIAASVTPISVKPAYEAVYGIVPSEMAADDTIYIKIDYVKTSTGQRLASAAIKATITP